MPSNFDKLAGAQQLSSPEGSVRRTEFLARVDLPPGPTPEERIKAFIDAVQHGPAFKVENVAHQTRASACKAEARHTGYATLPTPRAWPLVLTCSPAAAA
jgi:hypothetical protein